MSKNESVDVYRHLSSRNKHYQEALPTFSSLLQDVCVHGKDGDTLRTRPVDKIIIIIIQAAKCLDSLARVTQAIYSHSH